MSYKSNVLQKQNTERVLRDEENSLSLNRFKKDVDRIKILLMGDEHIGSPQYDKDLHLSMLEQAYNKGWYILHMGDGIEAATRNSIGSGVYAQETIIDQQMSDWINTYKPFVENGTFIGAHIGNHESRAMKDDGVNLMRHMCREAGAKYLGIARAHLLRVGNQSYTAYTTHGSSGARLPYTKIKGALDLERVINAEIYAMGHVHQLSHHVRNFYEINKRNKQVQKNKKHFVLTGSYLDYPNSYAQVKCMEPARMGSPLLTLYGDKHEIEVSLK